MTSLTAPPTVSRRREAAVYTPVSQAATGASNAPIEALYQAATFSLGIREAGCMPSFHTGWTLTAFTPGMASTFSR